MPVSEVTVKMSVYSVQRLRLLLSYMAGKLPEPDYRASLRAMGAKVPDDVPIARVTSVEADVLRGEFS